MKRREKCTEYLKYEFTIDENSENAKTLARKTRGLAEHDLKKKQLSADLKREEEGLNAEIAQFSRFVTDGYDFRNIECKIIYDKPERGQKTVIRIDTGEIVKEDRMTSQELQEELPLAG